MKEFFTIVFLLLALLTSCGVNDNEMTDTEAFEETVLTNEDKEQAIAEALQKHEDLEDVAVSINGGIAVVGLDLVNNDELCHTDIIAIKQRTVDEVKQKFDDINHVAVTTNPDMFQKLVKPETGVACPKESDVPEIFEIMVPTP
ncbi:MAG: YhcN/YlaJ family sporulation lipoprotein [Defluviitaleaceae bacterium]|nr:YhcN/YlaJ family sporulation lipoprotein [Defluviitaleaceae bacterium]